VRHSEGTLPTDFGFGGQRHDSTGLIFMHARYYHAGLGRFTQADTIVPEPGNPQAFNRYSYVRNRPLNRVDPDGHQDVPPPESVDLVQQAVDYFMSLGWQVVGDPSLINPNCNGADLVFTAEEGARVLAVELKDVAGSVNLGTLGQSVKYGDRGGSIARLARSSKRFYDSSVPQLRLMCRTVRDAYDAGTLENTLFTSSRATSISQNAQELFDGVYRVGETGQVEAQKALDKITTAAGAGAPAVTAWQAFKAWAVNVGSTPLPPIILIPRSLFDDLPWLQQPQQG